MIVKVNAKVWQCTDCKHRWFSRTENKTPTRCPNWKCRKQEKTSAKDSH